MGQVLPRGEPTRLTLTGCLAVVLLLSLLHGPAARANHLEDVHPDDMFSVGVHGPAFQSTVGNCDEFSGARVGGCTATTLAPPGDPYSLIAPESGGIVQVALEVQSSDDYLAALALLQRNVDGVTKVGFPELDGASQPLADIAPGSARFVARDFSDAPLSIAQGQQAALDVLGPAGPSLYDVPGRSTPFFSPPLSDGETRAFPPPTDIVSDTTLPMSLVVERQADVVLGAYLIPDFRRGLVRNARAELIFQVTNFGGPAIARDVVVPYELDSRPRIADTLRIGGVGPPFHPAGEPSLVTRVVGPFKLKKPGKITFEADAVSPTRDANLANNAIEVSYRVKGGDHHDFVPPPKCRELVGGTPEADVLSGTRGNDLIVSLDGADEVKAKNGGDCVLSGPGDDSGTGGGGNDAILGEAGDDQLEGDGGPDYLDGGEGDDVLIARRGGSDTVECGPGKDLARVDGRDRVGRDCEMVKGR